MLRVGLVGVGEAGRHHMRALAAAHTVGRLSWTAVAARDPVKLEARRDDLGLPRDVRAVSIDELLAGGACDAAIIASPDGLHHAHARVALDAGLHVLVEKPLALDPAHARDLVAAANAARRVLAVGYHLRHHAGHQLVRERLPELIGELRTIDLRWGWRDPAIGGWRARGLDARWWSLAALGTHALDLALWWADAEVVETACLREPREGPDRAAELVLRFATGALAHVSVAVSHRAEPWLAVVGDRGEIEGRGTLGPRGAGTLVHRADRETEELTFAAEDPYIRQLRAFVARCGGDKPRVDDDAVANVELLARL